MNIKKVISIATVAAVALMIGSTSAVAGIAETPHNMNGKIGNPAEADGRVCVFCHTPHAANNDMIYAPLWNKPIPTTAFTMYGTTIAGTATADAPSMVSLACLSCHDGTSAINSVINAPGSGMGPGFVGTAAYLDGVFAIGKDGLTNDHPVSIDYITGRAGLYDPTTPLVGEGWGAYTTINDMLRNGKVECGSCHDPHNADHGSFLRNSNTGSALCLTCHDK